MRRAIVIGTMQGREAWLNDCVASLRTCSYPVVPMESPLFELSVIYRAATEFDEFIFLPDSTEVLDVADLTAKCFGTSQSVSLSQVPGPFGMYLGKYLAKDVLVSGVPHVLTKMDAIRYETEWANRYAALAPYQTLGDLPHSDVFVEKYGRLNMVCENRWLRRYKASWDWDSAARELARIQAEEISSS